MEIFASARKAGWCQQETSKANATARIFLAPLGRQPFSFDWTGEKQINQSFIATLFADLKTGSSLFDFQFVARVQVLALPDGLRNYDLAFTGKRSLHGKTIVLRLLERSRFEVRKPARK